MIFVQSVRHYEHLTFDLFYLGGGVFSFVSHWKLGACKKFVFKLINVCCSVPNGLSQADVLADMTEYLQDFPTDLLLDSSSFFSQFSRLLSADRHDGADLATVKDVVHGKKDVAIPPGDSPICTLRLRFTSLRVASLCK